MTILNLGSLNWDRIYRLPHLPRAGETISSKETLVGLGGKGLNQSVAVVRAGGAVRHVGAISAQDGAMRAALEGFGLDHTHVVGVPGVETGTALILIDADAENCIVLDPGANRHIPMAAFRETLAACAVGDWFLAQNETNLLAEAMTEARAAGLKIAFVPAPFDAASAVPLLPLVDLLSLNAVEFEQLCVALGGEDHLPQTLALLITRGAQGAEYVSGGVRVAMPAFKVDPVDTTGAGDTFMGYFLALQDGGQSVEEALRYASAAGALQVTRLGAAGVIPTLAEVTAFLEARA